MSTGKRCAIGARVTGAVYEDQASDRSVALGKCSPCISCPPMRVTDLLTDHLNVVSDLPHSARAEGRRQQKDGELGSGPMTTKAMGLSLAD